MSVPGVFCSLASGGQTWDVSPERFDKKSDLCFSPLCGKRRWHGGWDKHFCTFLELCESEKLTVWFEKQWEWCVIYFCCDLWTPDTGSTVINWLLRGSLGLEKENHCDDKEAVLMWGEPQTDVELIWSVGLLTGNLYKLLCFVLYVNAANVRDCMALIVWNYVCVGQIKFLHF